MSLFSRRDVLAGFTLALTGLGGCQQSAAQDTPTATATERSYTNTVSDPAARTVRNPDSEPAVTSSAHSPQEDFVEGGSNWGDEHWSVGSESERDALQYAQSATNVEAAQSFVAETGLSAETLVVNQYRIEPCRTLRLDRLQWADATDAPEGLYDVELAYTDTEPDADCEEDGAKVVEATLFRIPAEIRGFKSFSWSG